MFNSLVLRLLFVWLLQLALCSSLFSWFYDFPCAILSPIFSLLFCMYKIWTSIFLCFVHPITLLHIRGVHVSSEWQINPIRQNIRRFLTAIYTHIYNKKNYKNAIQLDPNFWASGRISISMIRTSERLWIKNQLQRRIMYVANMCFFPVQIKVN